jgi:hypothetical protein
VDDWGSPVATTNTAYGALPSNGMTVELASLYEMGVDTPPAASGTLFKFTADNGIDPNTTVTITANALREGIVMEDGRNANLIAPGCTIVFCGCCFPYNGEGGQQAYDDAVAFGCPSCWCEAYQCDGDADGQTEFAGGTVRVGPADVAVVAAAWLIKEPPKGPGLYGQYYLGRELICADIDHKTEFVGGIVRVGPADIAIVAAYWLIRECPKCPPMPNDGPK